MTAKCLYSGQYAEASGSGLSWVLYGVTTPQLQAGLVNPSFSLLSAIGYGKGVITSDIPASGCVAPPYPQYQTFLGVITTDYSSIQPTAGDLSAITAGVFVGVLSLYLVARACGEIISFTRRA